jgi:hypothetical protein
MSNNNPKAAGKKCPFYTVYCGAGASRSGEVACAGLAVGAGVVLVRAPGSAPCESGL